MKRIAVLSAVVFCSSVASAQQAPPAESKKDASAMQSSVANEEDTRMKALENQVRTLAENLFSLNPKGVSCSPPRALNQACCLLLQ